MENTENFESNENVNFQSRLNLEPLRESIDKIKAEMETVIVGQQKMIDQLLVSILANGHVFPEVDRLNTGVRYKNPMILYRNNGTGSFEDVSARAGPGLVELHASRGAAFGDIDNDGSIEIVVNNQNERPALLKQSAAGLNHWIALKLTGSKSNRGAIGARVRLTVSGHSEIDEVRSGGSYLSQNDLRLHFGLGPSKEAERIEIAWPSGARQSLEHVKADRVWAIREPGAP